MGMMIDAMDILSIGNGMYVLSSVAVRGLIDNLLGSVESCVDAEGKPQEITLDLLRGNVRNRNKYTKLANGRFSIMVADEDSFNYGRNHYEKWDEGASTDNPDDILKLQTCLNLIKIFEI